MLFAFLLCFTLISLISLLFRAHLQTNSANGRAIVETIIIVVGFFFLFSFESEYVYILLLPLFCEPMWKVSVIRSRQETEQKRQKSCARRE